MKIYLSMFLVFVFFNLFAQKKQVEEAIRNGYDSNKIYTVRISSDNSLLTPDKVIKWFNSNKKYILVDYESQKEWAYGGEFLMIKSFSFINKEDIEFFNEFQRMRAIERAKRAEEKLHADILFSAVVIGGLTKLVSNTIESLNQPRTSSYSYSSSYSSTSKSSSSSSSSKSSSTSSGTSGSLDYKTMSIPSYRKSETKRDGDNIDYWMIKFNDGVYETLHYNKSRNEYYIVTYNTKIHYKTEEQAIRALYIAKKYDEIIKF